MSEKIPYNLEQAREEAEKIKLKAKELNGSKNPETGDYEIANEMVERNRKESLKLKKEAKEGLIIENKELKVSYIETYEDLPKDIQEQTGLKRMRIRKVLSYPNDFYSNKSGNEVVSELEKAGTIIEDIELPLEIQQITGQDKKDKTKNDKNSFFSRRGFKFESHTSTWEFLTDGRFPSYKTWTHKIGGDWSASDSKDYREMIEGFHEKGMFQEFFPEKNFQLKMGINFKFFEKKEEGDIIPMSNNKIENMSLEEAQKSLSVFDMSVMDRGKVWTWNGMIDAPIFIFGGRNKVFTNYIKKITENPETKKMLEIDGWILDNPLELIQPNSPDYKKYEILTRDPFGEPAGKNVVIPRPKIEFPKEHIKQDDSTKYNDIENEEIDRAKKSAGNNISIFNYLFNEENVAYYSGYPPSIPTIKHPDIPPFRLSHAELAIIPKEKDLKIIFFE